ncbi:MAG TPA: NAD-glutamate dehydrogenase, partial [Nevskiaceae bacterium]|nr:NAD-glutamate dehydrogenase [Nevskiaceae bacterium]
ERDGLLNRTIEFLPDDESLKERRSHGRGLTRPELSVLLAYSKISLKDAMLKSQVPDDPYFERDLLANFPPLLVKKFGEVLVHHQLKREIVATMLTNAVVNRMGVSFSHRLAEDHGQPRAQIIKAYAAAHQIYDADRYWTAIESLDNKVKASLQYALYERAIGLLKHVTGWIVNSDMAQAPIGAIVARFAAAIPAGEKLLPDALPASYRADWDKAVDSMVREGVPQELAVMLANTKVLGSGPDVVELAEAAKAPLTETAQVYFEIGDRFSVLWLLSAIIGLSVQSKWQALARANLRDDVYRLQRRLASQALRAPGKTAQAKVEAWMAANEEVVSFARRRLNELQTGGAADFMSLAVAVRALRDLRTL